MKERTPDHKSGVMSEPLHVLFSILTESTNESYAGRFSGVVVQSLVLQKIGSAI